MACKGLLYSHLSSLYAYAYPPLDTDKLLLLSLFLVCCSDQNADIVQSYMIGSAISDTTQEQSKGS